MRLVNHLILTFPNVQDAADAISVIDAIGEAYYLSLGYEILDNPRRVVSKNKGTGSNYYGDSGFLGWTGPYFYDNLHYIISPTNFYGEGWKDRYALASGPVYTEIMSPSEWFDQDGVPL